MSLPVLRSKDFVHQPRYQLWTDALCFREMAKTAPNNYLQSMCVRNAISAAWTTLEMACLDALGLGQLPDRTFKDGLKKALGYGGKPPIDFGVGLWQQVLKIQEDRNSYMHAGVTLANRFPPTSAAETALETMREGIHDIYKIMGKTSPAWVDFDESGGWPARGGSVGMAHVTAAHGQLDHDSPQTLRVVLLTETGDEKVTDYFHGSTPEQDVFDRAEEVLGGLNVPFSGIRVYRGPTLIAEELFEMRG